MQSIQALRERHASLAREARAIVEKHNGAWSTEHQSKYDGQIAELDDLKGQVDRLSALHVSIADERAEAVIVEHGNKLAHGAKDASSRLYATWLRGGDNALSAQDWSDIRATMSTTTTTEGGFTVQTDVAASVIDSMKAYGGMRSVSTILPTAKGNPLSFPSSDGTAEVGEIIAENTTATAADLVFGTVALNAYKFSSKVVAAPVELLQDSQIDIEAFIHARLTTRLGRITNTKYTIGTGTAEPFGLAARAASGKVGLAGQTLTVIFADLVDLIHSIDPAYRAAGTCRFMMNDASLKIIRKLVDSQNRPVFLPGYAGLGVAMPDTILGYEVTVNQDVAVMAANAKSIFFGDFKNFYIRDVMEMSLQRYTDSAYAKLGQVGFLMWMRTGSNLMDTASIKYYANSAT